MRYSLFRPIVFILVFFISLVVRANSLDSLMQLLPKLEGTEKVDLLNQLSWDLKKTNPEQAIQYAHQSIELSKNVDYTKGQAKALYHLAIIYSIRSDYNNSDSLAHLAIAKYRVDENMVGIAKCWNVLGLNESNKNNFQEATYYLGKALTIFEEVNNKEYILKLEANIGNIHFRQGEFDKALESYLKLLSYDQESNNQESIASSLLNVGAAYVMLGNYSRAFEHLFEALNIVRKINDPYSISKTLNMIGINYFRLEMFEEAITVYREAIAINKTNKLMVGLSENYTNLGNIFQNQELLDSAHHYFLASLKIKDSLGYLSGGVIYGNIGRIFLKRGEYAKAKSLIRRGLRMDSHVGKKDNIVRHHYNLGSVYLLEEKLDSAEVHLIKAFNGWDSLGIYLGIKSSSEKLVELYALTGNTKRELKYRSLYQLANDSLHNLSSQKQLMKIFIKKELNKFQNKLITEDETNSKENRKTQYLYLLIPLFVIITLVVVRRTLKQKEKRLAIIQKDLDQVSREMAFLSLSAQQKDAFINRFSNDLNELAQINVDNKDLKNLIHDLKLQEIESNNWNHFKSAFEQIAPSFFDHLVTNYPKLTDTDLRLCAMIRLNVSNQDIANILGISAASVNKARYRLRKRFELTGRRSLENFIASV